MVCEARQDPAAPRRPSGGHLRHGDLSRIFVLPLHDRTVARGRWRVDDHVLKQEPNRKAPTMTKMTDLSRRKLMQASATLGAGALAASTFPAWRARAAEELNMWWWGEQELPGLKAYVDDSVKNYTAATVKAMLQDPALLQSHFQTA